MRYLLLLKMTPDLMLLCGNEAAVSPGPYLGLLDHCLGVVIYGLLLRAPS